MKRETKINLIFALIFLACGVLGFMILGNLKKPVTKIAATDTRPILRTVSAKIIDHQVKLKAFGTLRAMERFVLKSEVSGSVSFLHPNLEAGGVIQAGEILVEVEQAPYLILVDKAKASLDRAKASLLQKELEMQSITASYNTEKESLQLIVAEEKRYQNMLNQGTVSRQEYDSRLNQKQRQEIAYQNALNRYQIQPSLIAQAKADLANAEAQIKQAEYDLNKTRIISPFTGKMLRKSVFIRQFISSGAELGELIGLLSLELEVPVPSHELGFLFPGSPDFEGMPESSPFNLPIDKIGMVQVKPLTPAGHKSIPVKISRVSPVLDPQKKTLNFFLEINNSLSGAGTFGILLPGTFCEVEIPGQIIKSVVRIPRLSIRGNQVQLVEGGLIQWREFEALRDEGSYIIASLILNTDSEFVLNATEVLKNGVPVRTVREESLL